jgi:RNA polymerase sigma factor (sigma-70 family)
VVSRRVQARSPSPGERTDGALVTGLRAGAAAAFDLAFETYRARIYSFLLRLTRNTALAGDLNQEVWLRLASHARTLQPDTQLGPWLFTVARNLFVSHRRWALLDRERLVELGLSRSPSHVPSPLDTAVGADVAARLERAIGALPAAQREVILLISVEGFGIDAVAKMLDTREETVRKRLSRARAAIKRALDSNDHSRANP